MSLIQYQNPFNIIDLRPENGKVDKKMLKLSKKKLLAEFELHDSITISIKGVEYDKTAILKLFAELESDIHLDHHIRIFNNPSLLSFLEKGNIQSLDKLTSDDFNGSAGFVNFVSLYFSNRYNEVFTNAVRQREIDVLEFISNTELPVAPRFESDCYQGAYRVIAGQVRDLRNLAEKIKKNYIGEAYFEKYIGRDAVKLLNLLPRYFSGLKDKYALALRDIAISIYNDHKKVSFSKKVLKRSLGIYTSENVTRDIQDILRQIIDLNSWSGSYPNTEEGQREKKMTWTVMIFLFGISVLLGRTCESSSTKYDFKLAPINTFEHDMTDALKLYRQKHSIDTEIYQFLEEGVENFLDSQAVNSNFQKSKRPKTDDQPYSGYFEKNVDKTFNYSSFAIPRDRLVFFNEGDYDAIVFIESLFGVVDHFYIRSGESKKIDQFKRIESQVGLTVWFGKSWNENTKTVKEDLRGGFLDSEGFESMPADSSNIKIGVSRLEGDSAEIEIEMIRFTNPGSGISHTKKTTIVPRLLLE